MRWVSENILNGISITRCLYFFGLLFAVRAEVGAAHEKIPEQSS